MEQIAKLRAAVGMTQTALAHKIGVTQAAISMLEMPRR